MTGSRTRRTQPPPRLLPVLYFAAAHVALMVAFGAVAIDPRSVSGFFYHAPMLGIVHLITLGWITASILGSLDRTASRVRVVAVRRAAARGRPRVDAVPFVSAGAWCLLAATLLDAVSVARILRHAFATRPAAGPPIVTVF